MHFLGSFKITTKVLAIAAVLNIAIVVVGAIGVMSLRQLSTDSDAATKVVSVVVASPRINQKPARHQPGRVRRRRQSLASHAPGDDR